MTHLTVLFSCIVATEEELNLVKQMLEQKQREIDNLTSLLRLKEGKESNVRCDIYHSLIFMQILNNLSLYSSRRGATDTQKEDTRNV